MRVVVHSDAIQDRDGAGLVLDKKRRCFGGGRCCVWRLSGGATT
jgi:hypothetical protein